MVHIAASEQSDLAVELTRHERATAISSQVLTTYAEKIAEHGRLLASSTRRSTGTTGQQLATSFSAAATLRLNSVLFVEAAVNAPKRPPLLDYSALIFLACQLLQGQLGSMLWPLLAGHQHEFVALPGLTKEQRQLLDAWYDKRLKFNLMILRVFLVALRCALEQERDGVVAFTSSYLTTSYVGHLLAGNFERALDHIYSDFWKPASDGELVFSKHNYESFAALVIGSRSFTGWYRRGPTPSPPSSESALLHHHLVGWRPDAYFYAELNNRGPKHHVTQPARLDTLPQLAAATPVCPPNAPARSDSPRQTGDDVFISFNHQDRSTVRELALLLRERGLDVWLDEWKLTPGDVWQEAIEAAIKKTRAAIICIGPEGLGPWGGPEVNALMLQATQRNMRLIPLLLPGASELALPLFLEAFMWTDCREGFRSETIDRLEQALLKDTA